MKTIPLSEPVLGGNEWKYVRDCLDTSWVSSVGRYVDRFEADFARLAGARHAIAAVNGTAALHLALQAVGVRRGDEVLVSNLTFIAPANAIRYCGAHPVLMDADPATWQMDPRKVELFLKERCRLAGSECRDRKTGRPVRALLAVHILGSACPIDRLARLARRWKLKLVEDAAEGVGVRYQGRHVGTFGDAGAFSFNGNKIVTTGAGGMVVTGDRRLADYVRYLSTQAKDDPLEYFHNEVGYNYRLSNVHAALGVAQLQQLPGFIRRKKRIAALYAKAFSREPRITVMPVTPGTDSTYWLYTVLLPPGTTLAERKAFVVRLHDRGIGARPLWHTLHDLPPYRGCLAYRIEHSPGLYRRAVSLPSWAGLSDADIRRCAAAVLECL